MTLETGTRGRALELAEVFSPCPYDRRQREEGRGELGRKGRSEGGQTFWEVVIFKAWTPLQK